MLIPVYTLLMALETKRTVRRIFTFEIPARTKFMQPNDFQLEFVNEINSF